MIIADKIEIKIGGKTWDNYVFSDICLTQEIQKPTELRFRMHKNTLVEDEKELRFSLSNNLLGEKIQYLLTSLRTDVSNQKHEDKLEFNGIIFDVNAIRSSMGAGLVIEVIAYSPDYLLCDSPHCYSYENENLKKIVTETLKPYDIQSDIDTQKTESIPYVVQYNETNYQFINRLAQRYGEWLYYDGKKLVFGKLKKQNSIELYPDFDILNYRYQLDLEHLKVKHASHNYLDDYGNPVESAFKTDKVHNLTDICYEKSNNVYQKETFQTLHNVTNATQEDKVSEAIKHSVKVLGFGKKAQLMVCTGHTNRADLQIGSVIEIKEFYNAGEKSCMHDKLLICKITHLANSDGKYENEFYAIPANSEYPPYSFNDLYPSCEPQRAVVTDNQDPKKLGRVRVQFLWQKEQNSNLMTPWIRIAQPHGGNNKGFYFIPEIGEEVMVGFENGNAEKPYVTGTLYHGEQVPGSNWYNDSNDIKAIRTRNGHTVEIYDKDEGGYIKIYDNGKNNYILTFSTDDKRITLESTGDIRLHAENDIIMTAKNNIDMHAEKNIIMKADVDMKRDAGKNITTDAGENITTTAGKNITTEAKNDMDTKVANNDRFEVGKNQNIKIKANKDETITKTYQLDAETLRTEAKNEMLIYSKTHEQKSSSSMKIDGSSGLDLKANNIKIN